MSFSRVFYVYVIIALLWTPTISVEESPVSVEDTINPSDARKVEALENSIRQTANMSFTNYKFYPFAIATTHEFLV